MGTTKNTKAVAPPVFTVRVLGAVSKKPITGLYIAFKLWRPTDDQYKASVARVVSTVHKKEFSEKRYQHLYEHYKVQEAQTVDDPAERFVLGFTDLEGYLEPVYQGTNPWQDRANRLEPDSFKFTVGEEYEALYIRHPSADVARTATLALNKQEFVRTDVNFRDATVWGTAPESSAIGKWLGLGGPALHRFTVEAGSGNEGAQFVIHLPETPDAYVPLWKGDSKRWWLYAGMPHGHVESVRKQVEEFVGKLGPLKYPATGNHGFPYSVAGVYWLISRPSQTEAGRRALEDSLRTFHGALQAATARFQEHLAAGESFKPVNWELAQKDQSWASEIGVAYPLTRKHIPDLEQGGVVGPVTYGAACRWTTDKLIKPTEHLISIAHLVLMLGRGAFAFTAWSELAKVMGCPYGMSSMHSYRHLMAEGGGGAIKNSIHKTGLASDMTGGRQRTSTTQWPIRFEAEFRRLKPGLSEYELEVERKQQALNDLLAERDAAERKANEKLAAAELLATTSAPKARPAAQQKVAAAKKELKGVEPRYAQRIAKAKAHLAKAENARDVAQKEIAMDSARLPERWRMRFRLYGHSTEDVYSSSGATPVVNVDAVRKIQEKIALWAGIESSSPDAETDPSCSVRGGFAKYLRSTKFDGLPEGPVNDWFIGQFQPIFEFAIALVRMDPVRLVNEYYRDKIVQWRVNFYETDGGTDMGTPHYPGDGDADFPVYPGAKSWLNLSAIGHGCQMHRIGPHKYDTRDKTTFAKDPEMVPPIALPMNKYYAFEESKAEAGDIVAAIEDITASPEAAPQLAHRQYQILIVEPTGQNKETRTVAEIKPSDIDVPFFKEWRRSIHEFKNGKYPAYPPDSAGVFRPRGAQVSVVLNGLAADRAANLQKVIDLFGKTFGAKKFEVSAPGSTDSDEAGRMILTGEEIAEIADSTVKELKLQAEERKKAADAERAREAGRAGDKAKKQKKDVAATQKPKPEQWSFLAQPVFAEGLVAEHGVLFQPQHIVLLPARENAAHLEWWHFQHHSVAKSKHWGELLEECGYSLAVLGTPAEGTPVETAEPVHIGLGYSWKKELNSTPWPSAAEIKEQPSNFDPIGSEDIELPSPLPEVVAGEGDA